MIDKQEFYHGAAVVRLFEDQRCKNIKKHNFGYIVNDEIFIFLKYRTKSHTPWSFGFDNNDISRINSLVNSFKRIVVGLVCGGDGICPILWQDAEKILGNNPGSICVRRKFNEQYGVKGSVEAIKGKISLQEWPTIVFDN